MEGAVKKEGIRSEIEPMVAASHQIARVIKNDEPAEYEKDSQRNQGDYGRYLDQDSGLLALVPIVEVAVAHRTGL